MITLHGCPRGGRPYVSHAVVKYEVMVLFGRVGPHWSGLAPWHEANPVRGEYRVAGDQPAILLGRAATALRAPIISSLWLNAGLKFESAELAPLQAAALKMYPI